MNPLDYLHLQMRLEGKEIFQEGLVRQVEVVPGEELPLMLLAKLRDGFVVAYYHESIPSDLQKELAHGICDIEFPKVDALLNILKHHTIGFEIGHYRTYTLDSIGNKELVIPSMVSFCGRHEGCANYKQSP